MTRIWLPIVVIVAVAAAAVIDFQSLYPQLPARIASHFNAQGVADGWMTKSQFETTSIEGIFIVGLFVVLLPVIIWYSPASIMNLPHREYWLAPERAKIARLMIIERMLWFLAATIMLVASIEHGVLKANLPPGGRLECWPPLGGYLAFMAIWIGEMYWAFRKPATDTLPPDDRALVA